VLGFPYDRCGAVDFAPRILKIKRVQNLPASIALVSSRIGVAARSAFTLDEAVRQESVMLLAVELICPAFLEEIIGLQLQKDILSNLTMQLVRGTTEDIAADVEPTIDVGVNGKISIAELFGRAVLCKSFHFRSCSVFVSTCRQLMKLFTSSTNRAGELKCTTHHKRTAF